MRQRYSFVLTPYNPPAISIAKPHTIGLSAAFRDTYGVDRYRFVVPYFDPDNELIALRFTNDERDQGRVRVYQARYVSAASVFRLFSLDAEKLAGRYMPVRRPLRELGIDEPGDGFVIDLKAPTAPRLPQQP